MTRRWTPQQIELYRGFVRDTAVEYGQSAGKVDCADWAFLVLIRFAGPPKDLPVSFQNAGSGKVPGAQAFAGGTHYAEPDGPDAFKTQSEWTVMQAFARSRMGAKEILETGLRTVDVPKIPDLTPGDMLALVNPRITRFKNAPHPNPLP